MNPYRSLRARCRRAHTRLAALDVLEPRMLFSAVVEFDGEVQITAGNYGSAVFDLTVHHDGPLSISATGEDAHDTATEGGTAGFTVQIFRDLDHDNALDEDELVEAVLPEPLDLDPRPLGAQVSDSATGTITAGDYLVVVQSDYGYWKNALNPNTFVSSFAIDVTTAAPEIGVTSPFGVELSDGAASAGWIDGTFFGAATTGDIVHRTFTVTNTGDIDLTIDELILPNGLSIIEALDATIAAGQSDTFTVSFDPGFGDVTGDIEIKSNDTDEATFDFAVVAHGRVHVARAQFKGLLENINNGSTTPNLVAGTDFGKVEAGQTVTRTFTLSNLGDEVLQVVRFDLPEGFRLVGENPGTVAAYGAEPITIEFYAAEAGTYTGDVHLINSDATQNRYTFRVTGEVTAPEAMPNPAISDFDGDGQNDLVFRWGAMGNTWAINTGSGAATALPRLVDANWKIAGVADFDGDLDADLLFRNAANGRIAVWRMEGTTRVEAITLPAAPAGWQIGGVADFNADGQGDIFLRNVNDGRNTVWTIDDGRYVSSTLTRQLANRSWMAVGAGDFDADGKGDVLFRNASTGENAIWKFDGLSFHSVANAPALADQNWRVADVKDFDGDGDADIAWRNAATGRNAIWRMDHASRVEASTLAALPNTQWLTAGQAEPMPVAARPAALGWWQRQALAEKQDSNNAGDTDSLLDVEPLVTLPTVG